jgi:hypothetical protein
MSAKLLCNAIKIGDVKKVSKYISDMGVEAFSIESDGETIPTLHFAVEHDISEGCKSVKTLIDAGANIERYRYQPQNVSNENYIPLVGRGDCSALAYAVLTKNIEAVKVLLENDADPDGGKQNHLETPIVYAACLSENEDAEKFLDELVCWYGKYDIKDLTKIVRGKCNSTKVMKKKDEKYDGGFSFFDGDKKSRIKLLNYLDKIYKENVKPLEYYENLDTDEFESEEETPKKKSSKKKSKKTEEELQDVAHSEDEEEMIEEE